MPEKGDVITSVMRRVDIPFLTNALRLFSGITGLDFSLYDTRGNLLITPSLEDPILGRIKKDEIGQKLYNDFLSKYMRMALKGNKPLIIQAFTMQYQVFMPIYQKDTGLIAISNGFFMSREDFDKFNTERKEQFGLAGWSEQDEGRLKFIDYQTAENYINAIKPLLENIISSGHEKEELNRKLQWSRTIINLAANTKWDAEIEEIRRIIADTVIFLFNVDTAALFSIKKDYLYPELALGRSRDAVGKLRLPRGNKLVARSIETREPVSAPDRYRMNSHDLPEEINSVYLFPIHSQLGIFGFLGIFNSILEGEVFEAVNEICKLWAYLFGARYMGDKYRKCLDDMELISKKTLQLFSHYKDQQTLCDEIVNESAALVGAEKCSIMLPDETGNSLRVVSVKGVNKLLMKDVSLRAGEGIAGKVFEQGEPILIDGAEQFKTFLPTPRPLFKTQSCMSIPLKLGDETLGTLNLSDKATGKPFDRRDLAAMASFAVQASILLKLNGCHRAAEQKAMEDRVTGLLNQRFFDILLEKEYRRAVRYNLYFSVALLDIDDFKVLAAGRPGWDHLLREIASIMADSVRANDVLARPEGADFAIIMPQTNKAEAFKTIEKIKARINAMPLEGPESKNTVHVLPLSGPVKNITLSAGIATFPECCESLEAIMTEANKALYSAKARGKNQTASWDDSAGFKPVPT